MFGGGVDIVSTIWEGQLAHTHTHLYGLFAVVFAECLAVL